MINVYNTRVKNIQINPDQSKKDVSKKNIIPCIILGASLLGFIAGILVTKSFIKMPIPHETRLKEQYVFINPLLECNTEFEDSVFPNAIKRTLTNYIDKSISQKEITAAAVYYRDLNNGPWFSINGSALFTPASLIKVPIMMVYYKKAENEPGILETLLEVKEEMPNISQDDEFKPDRQLVVGNKYTIDELINHMIIYSDNTAYKVLKDNLTISEFNEVFSDLGIDIVPIVGNPNEKVLSLVEYSSLFRVLYNSSYLSRQYSERALKLLSEVVYDGGIVGGVPNEVVVSHKFGERSNENTNEKQLHDCGIVYSERNPYLLCIMTRGTEFDKLSSAIREISRLTYGAVGRDANLE